MASTSHLFLIHNINTVLKDTNQYKIVSTSFPYLLHMMGLVFLFESPLAFIDP